MCIILKIANYRVKWWKFGTRGTTVHTYKVLLMPYSLSLVWGHLVYFEKISNFTIFKTLLLSHFSSDFNQILL